MPTLTAIELRYRRDRGLKLGARNSKLSLMFARKIKVNYEEAGQRQPCPVKWLDSFAMRNFTNDQVFDDTLPTGDGTMEIGANVPIDRLKASMEDWFRRKSYLPKEATLVVEEQSAVSTQHSAKPV